MHFFEDFHDAALVGRAQEGDMVALEALIQRYQGVLYTVAAEMLGDAGRAREVTRSALVRTYGCMSHCDETCGFLSSAHCLLIDECLAVLRRGPVRLHGTPVASEPAGRIPGDAAAFRALTFDQRCARVRAAIQQLFPESRAIVILRHVAGLSYDEMAITLDLPIERVRSRLHAVRQHLGEQLLGWPRHSSLSAWQEDLLHGHTDGALDYRDSQTRERLLAGHAEATVRAAELRELGHFLNVLAPADPPTDLTTEVLTRIALLDTEGVRVKVKV